MKLQARAYVEIPRPLGVVFEAIVDPRVMSRYFISGASGRLEAGTTVTWVFGDVGAEIPLQVVEVEPERHVSFIWAATGSDTLVSIDLRPLGEQATAVEIVERGWDADEEGIERYGEQIGGWVDMLLCLKAYMVWGINLRSGERVSDEA